MAEENEEQMPLTNESGKRSQKNPIIPVLGLIVFAGILSYVLAKFVIVPMVYEKQQYSEGEGDKAQKEAIQELENKKRFTIEDMMTNLGAVDARYIRVSFTLEGTNSNFDMIISSNEERVRDAALTVLQSLSMNEARQQGVKNMIASNMIAAINRSLEPAPPVVENIYFTKFVVQ